MLTLWILLIATFVFSAAGMFPSTWYKVMGEWCLKIYRGHSRKAFEKELASQTGATGFAAETSYFDDGIGLAIDRTRGLLFAANNTNGKMDGMVVKLGDIASVTRGEKRDYGFYDYFVEITAAGGTPFRLICGETPEKADEILHRLETLKA
jgi:hypothetical protein